MFKVIVERPRIGGKGPTKRHRQANEDPENLPTKESMKAPYIYGDNQKMLNENLNPLKRYLNKQVGRPWDKVFSEICEYVDTDSTVKKHVRDHIEWFVNKHVVVEDKKVYNKAARYRGYRPELYKDELYVDPKTGILRKYTSGKSYKYKYEKSTWAIEQLVAHSFGEKIYEHNGERKVIKMEYKDGILYRVFKDHTTREFSNYNKATATHAKQDLWSLRSLYDTVKYRLTDAKKSESPYIKVWVKFVEEEEIRREIAAEKLRNIAKNVERVRED